MSFVSASEWNASILSKGLFIDRDGVINVDLGFVYRTEDFIFKPGIFDLVVDANRKGYKVDQFFETGSWER